MRGHRYPISSPTEKEVCGSENSHGSFSNKEDMYIKNAYERTKRIYVLIIVQISYWFWCMLMVSVNTSLKNNILLMPILY